MLTNVISGVPAQQRNRALKNIALGLEKYIVSQRNQKTGKPEAIYNTICERIDKLKI